jgi:hypothetical protein
VMRLRGMVCERVLALRDSEHGRAEFGAVGLTTRAC